MSTLKPVECEILYEPAHYSRSCGCTIPAAWVAYLYDETGEPSPKWPCGDSRDEAVRNVRRQFGESIAFV